MRNYQAMKDQMEKLKKYQKQPAKNLVNLIKVPQILKTQSIALKKRQQLKTTILFLKMIKIKFQNILIKYNKQTMILNELKNYQ